MKLKWTQHARTQRNQVADYIQKSFGVKRRKRFIQEVQQMAQMLRNHPNLGPIDPLYADRSAAYRSVNINGLSKMVYRVEDDIIYIAAFWDCRREPQNQAEQTE